METSVYTTLYDRLIRGEEKLALVGLGYVGMPIAVEFAKHVKVIGFNHNEHRIQQYKSGIDPTNEVGNEVISKTTVTSQVMRSGLPRLSLSLLPCRHRLRMITILILDRWKMRAG